METSYDTDMVNLAAALDRVGGDKDLLEEIAQLFLESSPGMLMEIQAAVAAKDPKGLEQAAHALKGSIGNFGAHLAFQAAFRLEKLGRTGKLSGAEQAYRTLEAEMEKLRPALASLGQ